MADSATQTLVDALSYYVRDAQQVKHCLDQGGDPFYIEPRLDKTVLLKACECRLNLGVVDMIMQACASHSNKAMVEDYVNKADIYRETPLSTLCAQKTFPAGFSDSVRQLLSMGANPNPPDKKLPMMLYKHLDDPEAAKALGWIMLRLCNTAPDWQKGHGQTLYQLIKNADREPEEFRGFLEVAVRAYTLCYGFDYRHECQSFHHMFGALMANCTEKGKWQRQQAQIACYSIDYCRDIRDLLMDVSIRLLMPKLLLTTRLHDNEDFLRDVPIAHIVRKLLPVAAELIYPHKSVEALLGILKNWNDRHPEFPRALNPLAATGAWYPLTPAFTVPDGAGKHMKIVCLADSTALEEESDRLEHSAENLTSEGLSGQAHFFSVRDASGNPVSTFVLRRVPVGERYEDKITIPGVFNETLGYYYMEQHRAHKNAVPSIESDAAFKAFKYALETHGLGINLEQAGETPESKHTKAHLPTILVQVGDHINNDMVENRFAHYAKSKGVTFVPHTQSETKKFRSSDVHLFSGSAMLNIDGKRHDVALWNMSAEDCFRLSGADEKILGVIAALYPALGAQLMRGNAKPDIPKHIDMR